jgi:aerobic-type carbon monoxide dehydrogenase small subunit (CoxS/CutS family)
VLRVKLMVNGQAHELDVEPEMPLLWVLRDVLGLTGRHGAVRGRNSRPHISELSKMTVLLDDLIQFLRDAPDGGRELDEHIAKHHG